MAIPGVGISGYRIYAADGPSDASEGEIARTVLQTGDSTLTQDWNSTVYYQVKPVNSTGVEASSWASIAATTPSQTTQLLDGTPWIAVTLGNEPLYTLNVTNNVDKNTTFTLWYRGASGADEATQVGSGQRVNKIGGIATWTGLHAGPSNTSYELRWASGQADGPIAGPNLVVGVSVPVSHHGKDSRQQDSFRA